MYKRSSALVSTGTLTVAVPAAGTPDYGPPAAPVAAKLAAPTGQDQGADGESISLLPHQAQTTPDRQPIYCSGALIQATSAEHAELIQFESQSIRNCNPGQAFVQAKCGPLGMAGRKVVTLARTEAKRPTQNATHACCTPFTYAAPFTLACVRAARSAQS